MSVKKKGCNAERELIHLFWNSGYSAVRVAGSGSMGYPSPDILAGNGLRRIAVECKSTKGDYQYLTKQEVGELVKFCGLFGAEAWIGVRFNNSEWSFLRVEDLKETDKNFVIARRDVVENVSGRSGVEGVGSGGRKGVSFGSLVGI